MKKTASRFAEGGGAGGGDWERRHPACIAAKGGGRSVAHGS